MNYTICGIPITPEHAQRLQETINRIHRECEEEERKREALHFRCEYYATRNNPHSTFKGSVEEYIKRYLVGKLWYLKYYTEEEQRSKHS
jgi:hypothetical protein